MELQISIQEDKAELFLEILQSFKSDIIKRFKILDSKYVSDEEQREIELILKARTPEDRELAHSKTISIDV